MGNYNGELKARLCNSLYKSDANILITYISNQQKSKAYLLTFIKISGSKECSSWTRVRVRVELRVRLRVRLRVKLRVGIFELFANYRGQIVKLFWYKSRSLVAAFE